MDTWDDTKLSEVVEKKHGEKEKMMPKTDIICKYFLEALETSKYGWFWECPNGGDTCIYRHALPPGYVLSKDKKKLQETKEDEISLEDLIEKERAALGSSLTKVTLQSFLEWKKKKIREKKQRAKDEEAKKRRDFRAGRDVGLSGRELFTFNPDLVMQDDEEADDAAMMREKDENDEQGELEAHEIDASLFMNVDDDEPQDVNENGLLDEAAACVPGSSGLQQRMHINEDLFDVDDIPDDDDDDDEEEEEEDERVNGEGRTLNASDELNRLRLDGSS